MLTINKDSFKKEVLDYQGLVFVDFYADWCGPCKTTGPIIEEIEKEEKNIKFVKVNVDQNPDLVSQHSVFSIPTFIIYKNGRQVNQFVGGLSKEAFIEEIKKTKEQL